ncbi:MAG: DUF3775 domain-containing protein [Pseudomonadota bacterium]|jgi:hypothetical protein
MTRPPPLTIAPEKVFFIVGKARQFDTEDLADPNAPEATGEPIIVDPIRIELRNFIRELNEDEQIDLVALAWLGRGDGDLDTWSDLRNEAASAHNRRTASYLLGMPLLASYLEEAMAQFGYAEEDFEADSR